MVALLAFAGTLFVAVLISERAERSVLSTAVLFLFSGFVMGHGLMEPVVMSPEDPPFSDLKLALFSVLFIDGMRIGRLRDLPQPAICRDVP